MTEKYKIKKSDLSITVFLLIGILIVVNIFSYQIFYRWDLTQGKVYSISKASKNTVANLDDIVNIKAYFSESLPSQFISLKQEVADILEEYEAFSNGNIRVEFIDPSDDDSMKRELMMIGIPQLTFEVYEKDKRQLINGYMGIAISFGSNTESIPAVKRNTSDLEYQLTTAIKKVVSDEIATIGFLTTQGTASLENNIRTAGDELAGLYTIVPVSLAEESPSVPDSVDTLIIVGPKEKFIDEQLKAINAFVVRGGALLVLMDGVNIKEGLQAANNESNLDELLVRYGIILNKNLVADRRSGMASFSQGFFTFSSNYAFWPQITNEGFNSEHSAVSNLENVIMPWASSVSVDTAKISEESVKNLAFTTKGAWSIKDSYDITPNSANTPKGATQEYVLAVAVNGMVPNAYADDYPEEQKDINGRLIVVGDSDFISDNFLRNTPDNLTLFQNLVDALSFDEDLIGIRSKGVTSRPIKELSDSGRMTMRYLNVFGITIIVITFGMIRYYIRRRSRFVDDL
ncbi:Gldg family protein [Candidatus Parcubacteria bacterium]|nr:Gldg family protein [Candidatus Parcubacteria bacterium]